MRQVLSLLFTAAALIGQDRPPLEDAIRRAGFTVTPAVRAAGSHEVTVNWRSTPSVSTTQGAAAPPTIAVQAVSAVRHADPPAKQRSAEMSRDHLVALVLDAQSAVRHWQIIVDPRFTRGEFPGAGGDLSNTSIYRADVTLTVTVPDNVVATEVRLLAPSWDAKGVLSLTRVAAIALPAGLLK